MSTQIESTENEKPNIHVYWKNLSYKTTKDKTLITNLNGQLRSGYLTAVLGPSGSGKTTLFECLAKRKINGVSGQIWASSSNSAMKSVRVIYNPQRDCLFSVLSIRESMIYACQMQKYCGRNIDILNNDVILDESLKLLNEDKHNEFKVNEIIDQLGLTQCADVRVSNCSGGQKKRLSIALELIFSPNVLLLDEPTTGLDSVSSLQLVQLLKSLVQSHPVIICASIHQPSAKLFSYFDNTYIISSMGTCIYNGPGQDLLSHLNSFNLNCPIFHNIADFTLEVASCLYGNETVFRLTETENKREIEDPNEHKVAINAERSLSKKLAYDQIYSAWSLFKRSSIISIREPFNYGLRFFGLIMIMGIRLVLRNQSAALIDNQCFNSTKFAKKLLEMGSNPDNFRITSFLSRDIILLITSIMFTVIISLVPSLMLFPLELSIFIKEHSNKWYTRWSYYVAKSLADLPPTLIFPMIYSVFTYLMVDQPEGIWRFFLYLSLIVITSLLSHSYSMVISVFFISNTIAALIVGAMLFVPFFIFSGFIIPIKRLPTYVRPFTYISIYRLAIESVLIIFFGFNRCNSDSNALKVSDFSDVFGGSVANISSCITEYTSLPSIEYLLDGYNVEVKKINQSIILSRFGLENIDLFINLGIMIGYIVILRLIAYFVLKWKSITN